MQGSKAGSWCVVNDHQLYKLNYPPTATLLNEEDDGYNESEAEADFEAELEAVKSRHAKRLKQSTRNVGGQLVSILFNYICLLIPAVIVRGIFPSGSTFETTEGTVIDSKLTNPIRTAILAVAYPQNPTPFRACHEASHARPDAHHQSGG